MPFFTSCWDLFSQLEVRYRIYFYVYLPALNIYAAYQLCRKETYPLAKCFYALGVVLSCMAIGRHCWLCVRGRARIKVESERESDVMEKGVRVGKKDDGVGEEGKGAGEMDESMWREDKCVGEKEGGKCKGGGLAGMA
jgi:hypothetical protein